jgi:hypothetical protein
MGLCHCGSGKYRRELKDARGIFCTFVCDDCERRRRAEFLPEIFTDPNYHADEPIDDY